MATVTVLNSDAGLSGKTLINAEDAQNVTGLKAFNRSPNAPFTVQAGSANVANLDADKLDGQNAPTGTIVGTSDTQTLTNKRMDPRVFQEASNAAPTPAIDSYDFHDITALAAGATFGAPTGTPANGQKLTIRVKDNATPRALAWNAIYAAGGATLPTTTTTSKQLHIAFVYNTNTTKWMCVAAALEA